MTKLTANEAAALRKAFEACDVYDLTYDDIIGYLDDGTASINEARNGKAVAWVVWGETKQAAVYVDTFRKLSDSEIESELC